MTENNHQLPENLENYRPEDFHFHPNFLGYPYFFNGKYNPWFDDQKDYNTNAPSYYDYLAHRNYNNKLVIDLLNRVARRNIQVNDTPSIDFTKIYDWISENQCHDFHDIIQLQADVKLSKQTKSLEFGTQKNKFTKVCENVLEIFQDGVFAPNYFAAISENTNKINQVDEKLDTEIENRKNADKELDNKINKEIQDRIAEDNKITEKLKSEIQKLTEKNGKLENALQKILNNLQQSGAISSNNIENFAFNPNRSIATGNINIFGGTPDGSSFIRTNSNSTENDLAGGL